MKKNLFVIAMLAGLMAGCGQGSRDTGGTGSSSDQSSGTNMGPSSTLPADTNKTMQPGTSTGPGTSGSKKDSSGGTGTGTEGTGGSGGGTGGSSGGSDSGSSSSGN